MEKEPGLVFTSLNESLTSRENRFYGFDAVEATVYQVFHTPRNSNPECPSLGFDLSELLFRSRSSTSFTELEGEIRDMILKVLQRVDVSVSITRPLNEDTTLIEIKYRHREKDRVLPIEIRDNGVLRFRQIVVR